MGIMDSNLDNLFKEKASSMDNKPLDWKKKETWELIQKRKSKHFRHKLSGKILLEHLPKTDKTRYGF